MATEKDQSRERRRLMKDIVLISACFFLVFNAFTGLSRLQSSLHRTDGMSATNQAVLYGTMVLSCLVTPRLVIGSVGHKWTIPLCFLGYVVWMAANGHAVWGSMTTASVVVGLTAAPLWAAQGAYFTKLGTRYAQIIGEKPANVLPQLFGIFFLFFPLSTVAGSIISFTVLGVDSPNETYHESIELCGVNDCPWHNHTNPKLRIPSQSTIWTMLGIYIGLSALAVILSAAAVGRLPEDIRQKKISRKDLCRLTVSTAMHVRNRNQLLLIPISMYGGFQEAFFNAEFSRAFISCPFGIWKVGLITLPFGILFAVSSYASGHLQRNAGRLPLMMFSMALDLTCKLALIFYPPDPSTEFVFYIVSGLNGFAFGIRKTQIHAFYGLLFSKNSEAAFSNLKMWNSMGFVVSFAYANYLCTGPKLYIQTGMLFVGMATYLAVEIPFLKARRTERFKTGLDITVTVDDTTTVNVEDENRHEEMVLLK